MSAYVLIIKRARRKNRFISDRSADISSEILERRMVFPVFRIYVDDGRWVVPYMKNREGHKEEAEKVLQGMLNGMFRKSVNGVSYPDDGGRRNHP